MVPDAIAEEILIAATSVLGPVLFQAIETLRTYFLIQRDSGEQKLLVYRLIQAVLREMLEENEQQMRAERAMQVICAVFP